MARQQRSTNSAFSQGSSERPISHQFFVVLRICSRLLPAHVKSARWSRWQKCLTNESQDPLHPVGPIQLHTQFLAQHRSAGRKFGALLPYLFQLTHNGGHLGVRIDWGNRIVAEEPAEMRVFGRLTQHHRGRRRRFKPATGDGA